MTAAGPEVRHTAFLDRDGRPLQDLPEKLSRPEILHGLYGDMVRARVFDAKAIELHRTGRLGTYASLLGQEAIGVGVGHAMSSEDVLLPSFREHAVQLKRGVSLTELFLYWGGDERGSDFAVPREDFPVSITVGGHAPHAAGVALAFKLRGEPRVAVCMFGDGATSKGDFYEAMNVAALWDLPLVFVVSNNQWAISTPRREQTAAASLAQKSIAAGFEGEQVDGNDVIAVASVMAGALADARLGSGPRLIECLTYRLGDHTTVDDARRYRSDAEVEEWREQDPIRRLRSYLTAQGEWSEGQEAELIARCEAEVDRAAEDYLATPPQAPESMFDSLYAELPVPLRAQREALLAAGGGSD
ncbi:MAG: pyruvate dehydrogenase (acetyl-transferring) E1 component subunit alpha [Pseudomonadales bacterium]